MYSGEEAYKTIYARMLEDTRKRHRQFIKTPTLVDKIKFYFNFLTYYLMVPPGYAIRGGDNRYNRLYLDQFKIYKNGKVVWGHLVQANNELFCKGRRNLPAAFIYSLDPIVDSNPSILAEGARKLFETKGNISRYERSEFAKISYILTDERIHAWKLPIPLSATEGVQCYYMSNMIFRKHLPNRVLSGSLFPFLVYPDATNVGFILPGRLWSPDFVSMYWYD